MARAGSLRSPVVTFVLCLLPAPIQTVVEGGGTVLLMVAGDRVVDPGSFEHEGREPGGHGSLQGAQGEGILGSRRTPWEVSIATIKAHPLLGRVTAPAQRVRIRGCISENFLRA